MEKPDPYPEPIQEQDYKGMNSVDSHLETGYNRFAELVNRPDIARFFYLFVIVFLSFLLVRFIGDGGGLFFISFAPSYLLDTAFVILFIWFLLIIFVDPPTAGSIDEEPFDVDFIETLIN